MKILQVHTSYRDPGGEDAVVAAEANLLRDHGHEVVTYSIPNPAGRMSAAASLLSAPYNPRQALRVASAIGRLQPHVVHFHNTWFAMSPAVIRAAHRTGTPVVMSLHNYRLVCANALLFRDGAPCTLCVGSHPWHAVRFNCYRSRPQSVMAAGTIWINDRLATWTKQVDLLMPLTNFGSRLFVQGGLPADRLMVKPNFTPDPGPRLIPAATSTEVFFAGRLSEEKGLRTLLEGWEIAKIEELHLTIAGDGPLRSKLPKPQGVTWLGAVNRDEVRRRMLSARALVVPSLVYEGLPMVVLEALSAGLPVLASDHGALSEVVWQLGTGFAVAPPSAGAWAQNLSQLVVRSDLDAASAAARRLYEAQFTPAVGLQLLEQAYRRAGVAAD